MLMIVFTVIYLFVMSLLAYKGYKATKNADDYLLAGRKIHPMVMALSYGAAFISTSAIVGFGGFAGVFGTSLLWLTVMNIFVGVFVAFLVFGKRTRKIGHNLQAHTFPEFLALRFQSRFIQKFSAAVIFIFMPLYAAAVMIGAAKFLQGAFFENVTEANYLIALFLTAVLVACYVFFGGLKGVMYADAFQGGLMFAGMLFLLVFVYHQLGGVGEAYASLSGLMAQPGVAEQVAQNKAAFAPGFRGWAAMPETCSINWLIVISSLTLGVGIGVLAQPQLAVKFMTVKSNRELNRAVSAGGVFVIMMTGVAFTVGALSNLFFYAQPTLIDGSANPFLGKVAALAAGGVDNIIPVFMKSFLPQWFTALFMVVLIAAGMSTMSSQFHAIATAFGRDLFSGHDESSDRQILKTRMGVLVAFILTLLLAWWLPQVWDGAIAIATALFFGLCAASFLPMYFAGLYCRSISRAAVICGMVGGFLISVFWMLFIYKKTAAVLMLCNALTGKPSLVAGGGAMKLMFLDPIVVALICSSVITAVAALLTRSTLDKAHIEKAFEGV